MFGLDRLSMGIVTLVVTVAVGLMVLSGMLGMSMVYDDTTVNDELHAGTDVGALPANVTVDNVGNGLVENSETIVFEDSATSTNTTMDESNYTVISYEDGVFQIDDTPETYNSTDDNFYFDYEYKADSEASDSIVTGNVALGSMMEWVGIIVLVVVASVILTILRSRGAFGGTTMRK